MTEVYTIGSNGKSPREFFEKLKAAGIELVIDVRLNNKSQLAGYAKGGNDFLGYLLDKTVGIRYIHDPFFAPTDEILDGYHKDHNWETYVTKFEKLVIARGFKAHFNAKYSTYGKVCLLCVESIPDQCHRRLVAEAVTTSEHIHHIL